MTDVNQAGATAHNATITTEVPQTRSSLLDDAKRVVYAAVESVRRHEEHLDQARAALKAALANQAALHANTEKEG